MTAPVTPVLPVTAAPATSTPGDGSAGGKPFASALHGALSAHGPVQGHGGRAGSSGHDAGDPSNGRGARAGKPAAGAGKAADGGPDATTAGDPAHDQDHDDPAATAAASGLPAVFWAVLQGGASPVPPAQGTDAGAGDPAVPVAGVPAAPSTAPGAMISAAASASTGPAFGQAVAAAAQEQRPLGLPDPTGPGASGTTPAMVAASTAVTTPTTGDPAASSAVATVLGQVVVAGPAGPATGGVPAVSDAASLPAVAVGAATTTATTAATAPAGGTDAPQAVPPDTLYPAAPLDGPAPARGTSGGSSHTAGDSDGSSPDGAPAGPDLTAPAPQASAATPATAAAAPAAADPSRPAPPPPVATQLGQHLTTLGRGPDGAHTMTVVLTPENLGPVQIQVTVSHGTLDLTLRGAHESGRAALMDALPDLRRDLQSAGLDCSRLDVSRDTGGSWTSQHSGSREGQGQPPWARPGWGESRRPWAAQDPAPTRQGPSTHHATTSSGVDLLV